MKIDADLKPLYANLKRLKIGEFLYSEDFKLYMLENNWDEAWNHCLDEVYRKKTSVFLGFHNTQDEEKAFGLLMNLGYTGNSDRFSMFITKTIIQYAHWHPTKLDLKDVYESIKNLNILDKTDLFDFVKSLRKIRDVKPNAIEKFESNTKQIPMIKDKVFIVHGHDVEAKVSTARFIEKLGFDAIILHEQASSSQTVIEKIESNTDVGFGIILYTPCDVGGKGKDNLSPRARQNVVFEHGYLIGRKNVCALVKDSVETPSDISGVVYIQMDTKDAWQISLAKELKSSGYDVDMNKVL